MPPDRLAPGTVMHTMGYPLRQEEFGGGFIYAHARRPAVGRLRRRPRLPGSAVRSAHGVQPLQAASRRSRALLDGGPLVRYGAKALPEGGWNTIPQPYMDGALIAGDAGGFLNSMRLKGIHLAMRTGMLAAETAFEAIRAGDTSAASLCSAIRTRSTRARSAPSCIRCATSTRHSATACSPALRSRALALLTRGWWPRRSARPRRARADADARAGTYGMHRICAAPSNATAVDRRADVRQGDQRALLGHRARRGSAVAPARAHRGVQLDLRPRVRAPVHAILSRPTSTRSPTRPTARRGCRSTRRTACTARRATSWIPTR